MREHPDDFVVEPMRPFAVGGQEYKAKFEAATGVVGTAGSREGLCPSCFDSGFVHDLRGDLLGLPCDPQTGALIRCTCPKGQKVIRADEESRAQTARR